MKITTDHKSAKHGHPVFLNERGRKIPTHQGIQQARRILGISTAELAGLCGCSPRTVENWESKTRSSPPGHALLLIGRLLEDAK